MMLKGKLQRNSRGISCHSDSCGVNLGPMKLDSRYGTEVRDTVYGRFLLSGFYGQLILFNEKGRLFFPNTRLLILNHIRRYTMNFKSLFSTLGLAISLTSFAVPGWTQESGIEGGSAGSDTINGTGWDSLASATAAIPNSGSVWHCAVTCSAEVAHVTGISTKGTLAVLRNGAPQSGSGRVFELNNNPSPIDDPSPKEVSTTFSMFNLNAGNHTMACAAKKNAAGNPNYRVNDSTISVVCSDFRL